MYNLNSNVADSTWHENITETLLDDNIWQHYQFILKPLNHEQPFNLLNAINSVPSTAESVTTSVESQESQESIQRSLEDEEDLWVNNENNNAPTQFNTLSWDTYNSSFPSHSQQKLAEKNIGQPFITEAPLSLYEPITQYRQQSIQCKVVYEADLVKSLIHAMVGLPSIHFYWHQQEFKMRARVRILGVSFTTIQPLLNEILLCGTHLKKMEIISNELRMNPEIYGLTGTAMGCCLSQLHVNMQYSMMSLFDQQSHMTLLKLHQYIQELAHVVKRVCALIDTQLPVGVEWINILQAQVKELDLAQSGYHALYRDICLSMLKYTSVPYLNFISQWLGLNQGFCCQMVDDPHGEFFIQLVDSDKSILDRYSIRNDAVLPYFIDKELSMYIFRSGISLQLLQTSVPNHPIFDLQHSLHLATLFSHQETDEYMKKLKNQCDTIHAHHSGTVIALVAQTTETSFQNDTQPTAFTLPPLEMEVNKGDFSTTLNLLINNPHIPTITTLTRQSYLVPINTWCPVINASFMASFLHQFKLQSHLTLLHSYFLFGNGSFVNQLKDTFFQSGVSLTTNGVWPPRDVNTALFELLVDEPLLQLSMKKEGEWNNDPSCVQALDFLTLEYRATYPLNIVITPNILTKYNRIFSFLLQLLRVSTVTKRMVEPLRTTPWFRQSTRDTLSRYRFEMDHFISAFQAYTQDSAIEFTWSRFMHHVQAMESGQDSEYVKLIMEPFQFTEYTSHILDRILYKLFLKQSQLNILQVLLPVLKDIIMFGMVMDDYTVTDSLGEEKLLRKSSKVFDQFQAHVKIFLRVLKLVEEKGFGRLSNILYSMTKSVFNPLYAKYEVKRGLDLFVRDLVIRLNMNGFYS